jgi:hypothetical protein
MQVGGSTKEIDFAKLGSTPVIASSLILAIRTAKWSTFKVSTTSSPEWDAEVDHSIEIARMVLSRLTSKYPTLFQQKDVPWYVATDDESPR